MGDVTVNIRGNAEQLKRELNDVSNQANQSQTSGSTNSPNSSSQMASTIIERVTGDLFDKFQSQRSSGGDLDKRYLEDLKQQKLQEANDEIARKYDSKRDELRDKTSGRYDEIDQRLARDRQAADSMFSNPNDPAVRSLNDQMMESQREREYRRVGSSVDSEENAINEAERIERTAVEQELTQAIRELSEQYNQQSDSADGSDSYIGQLRAEKRRLLAERDSADDEKAAIEKQAEIEKVNEKLKPFDNREGERSQGQDPYGLKILGLAMSGGNAVRALSEGNIGGAVQGAGGAVSSMIGGKAGMVGGAVTGIAGMIWELVEMFSGADTQYREFTRGRGVTGGELGTAGFGSLRSTMDAGAYGMHNKDIGLSEEDFLKEARERTQKSGIAQNWYQETMAGISLEKSLNLTQGSLTQGSQFDRYGKTVTDAVVGMVDMFSAMDKGGIKSGVTASDFTRVQEKYDIQQSIMSGYMGTSDRPSFNAANTMLGALSSTGVTQDSRLAGEAQSLQNMVRNPMNDRMRALVFDTASEVIPEAGGSMSKIDLMMKNPEIENKVIQAVVKRITQQFGGMDTDMGYFAMKAALPNIAPERLMEISKGIAGGTAGNILKSGGGFGGAFEGINKEAYIKQSQELVTGVAEAKVAIVDAIKSMVTFFGGKTNPTK